MTFIPPPDREAILKHAVRVSNSLSNIACERRISTRKRLDEAHVRVLFHAIRADADIGELVIAEVEGCTSLVDGFHRFEALQRSGTDFATFLRLPDALSLNEARWMFSALNWKAQLRLSDQERKSGFKAYIKAGGHVRLQTKRGTPDRYKSYREIAQELGIPRSTVFRWITDSFPSLALAMGTPDQSSVTKKSRGERLFESRAREIQRATDQISALGTTCPDLSAVAQVAMYNACLRLVDPLWAPYTKIKSFADISWKNLGKTEQ